MRWDTTRRPTLAGFGPSLTKSVKRALILLDPPIADEAASGGNVSSRPVAVDRIVPEKTISSEAGQVFQEP